MKIFNYPCINGFYSLGFVQEKYKEIYLISFDQFLQGPKKLAYEIEKGLEQNKKVCLFVLDEDAQHLLCNETVHTLNRFQNEDFFFVTQLCEDYQKIYTWQCGLKCKIVELPWWFLNDCFCYYEMCNFKEKVDQISCNFLTMANNYQAHKANLILKIKEYGLDGYGRCIVPKSQKHWSSPEFEFCYNPDILPYPADSDKFLCTRKFNNQVVSDNIVNYIRIEQTYNTPLIVHPETSPGIFFNTDKSLWPVLLGKLFLLYGGCGIMNNILRFSDFDLSCCVNLDFDKIPGYTDSDKLKRLETMLKDNIDIMKNPHDVYHYYKPELEQSRWTIGNNVYKFFIEQIENKILN